MGMSNHGWWLLLAALAGARAEASETQDATRPIYRCRSDDAVIFSDRPCDAAAKVYESDAPFNTYDPPKVTPRSRSNPVTRPRIDRESTKQAAAQAKLAEQCQRVQRSLRDIRSRMRAGYTAKEGERLRERQSKLEEQRRAAKCR